MAAIPMNVVHMPTRSPQLEDGYTRLANELLEALIAARLTARQWAVLMAIVRKTYGFNKKADDIGLGQLSSMTGIDKAHVSRTVRELSDMKVITRSVGTHGHTLGINKNIGDWGLLKEQPVAESATGCQKGNPPIAESATPPVAERATTKDNPSKDNHQKTETLCAPQADRAAKPARAGQTGRAMTAKLQERFDVFWAAYPKKKSKGAAEKAFVKINPDDQLLTDLLAGIERAKKSSDWIRGFIQHPATWLNARGWLDEIQTEYSPEEREVIEAYNAALGDRLGTIDASLFSEARAAAIRDFTTFSDKPKFWVRFFPWVAEHCDLPPHYGFDNLVSREGFSRVRGGQHQRTI